MGHGLGPTQKAMLDTLAGTDDWALTVVDLAERLDRSDRQIRFAARSLESRGLVVITKRCTGWAGVGEYGKIKNRGRVAELSGVPEGEIPVAEEWTNRYGYHFVGSFAGMPKYG